MTSIKNGPTKTLVDDVTSSSFRFKTVHEVFVQWTYKQEAFGLRCKNPQEAKNFEEALKDCKNTTKVFKADSRQPFSLILNILMPENCHFHVVVSAKKVKH